MHFFSFNSLTPEYIFGNIAFILLFIAVLLYWFDSPSGNIKWKNFSIIGANLALASLLGVRWFESGHFPLSNLYESLIGLSWGFTTVHLIVVLDFTQIRPNFFTYKSSFTHQNSESNTITGLLLRNKRLQSKKITQPYSHFSDKIGAITAPTALLTSVFANFFLPAEMIRATALIPALKSNWLTMHVTVMVASYAFLLVGSLLSIAFCVYRFIIINKLLLNLQAKEEQPLLTSNSKKGSVLGLSDNASTLAFADFGLEENTVINSENFDTSVNSDVEEVCIWLNTMSYRILGLGFPLLTIGILSGAVWANEAWGSYWSWDPKETWALITWLVFAVYFHSRYTRNSDTSPVPARIASVGFVTIWICYLGVNLIGTGLHSYGWFVY